MAGWRPWGAALGVVAAAAASIATSAPAWSLDDGVEDLSVRLDTNAPESVEHFTVSSSESHQARVSGTLTFSEEPEPQAAVLVRIESDDGDASEMIHRASDPEFSLALHTTCEQSCQQGYTVTLKLVDGWPSEHVDVDWSFVASIGGEGVDEPEDAFVTVTHD